MSELLQEMRGEVADAHAFMRQVTNRDLHQKVIKHFQARPVPGSYKPHRHRMAIKPKITHTIQQVRGNPAPGQTERRGTLDTFLRLHEMLVSLVL